jgi:site-specific DNA-methyltransferase (adenine-specific)
MTQKPYYQDESATLYLGDCREVLPTFPARSFDFVFTDPPYGHNNNNGDLIHRREIALGKSKKGDNKHPARPISFDSPDEAQALYKFALTEFAYLLKGGGCCCCCCCGGGGPDPQMARWALWMDEAIGFKQMVVWDKGPIGMGWHYRRSYETIIVGQIPGAACRWFDTSHRIENIIRPGSGIKKVIPSKAQHPTEKPVELSAHFISLHTLPGHVVLDPFAGVGTTGVASKRMGRKSVLVEIEERWCEAAAKRLQQTEVADG